MHSVVCYVTLMSKIKADAWQCDVCGHVWLVGEMCPKQCAKCRTRIWNCDEKVSSVAVAVVAVPPIVESKPAEVVKIERQEPTIKAGCKCGGRGAVIVRGKRCCASCGRTLGA